MQVYIHSKYTDVKIIIFLPSRAGGAKVKRKNYVRLTSKPSWSNSSLCGFSLLRNLWDGWVAVSPKFHQAVTPPLSTLSAIVIPGLFQLSYGRNVPLHEKRSSLFMAYLGSYPVFSQACQDMEMLSHTQQPSHSSMNNVDIYYAGSLTLFYPNYLEEVSMLLWISTLLTRAWFWNKSLLQFIVIIN